MVQDLTKMTEEQGWGRSAAFGLASPINLIPIPIVDDILRLVLKGIWKGGKIPFKAKRFLFKTKTATTPEITITPEELVAREAREKPGYVDTGEVDTVADKVADLNARAGPGDVKFAYIDPETGEFRITLLPEKVADDASRAGLGERIVNDDKIFAASYRAQVKQAAGQAADVPVVSAPSVRVIPDAPPSVRVISDDAAEVASEIRLVEDAIQDLSARTDLTDISPDRLSLLGNTWAKSNRWRQLFFEIDNNDERVLATTMAKFFRSEAPSKGVQDIVTWAQNRFPGSFREAKPRRVSTVKFDVLDERVSEWNEAYGLGVIPDAQGKVSVDEVLFRIRQLWNRVDGTAEYERLLRIEEERLASLNDSPAGQVLKDSAETAATRASAEELAALVEHPEDMLRFLRDMVGQETRERPGFLSEEFLARFDETVDRKSGV